jgi:hypothetical protein
MNSKEKLDLKKLLKGAEGDYVDNTDGIRRIKHSVFIRDDIRTIDNLKNTQSVMRSMDPAGFLELCQQQANFLYNNYTDLFNRLMKDELDLDIMTQLLTVLKLIEDGKLDQHEGSVMVGKVLKKLYIDSALKRGENLDKEYGTNEVAPPRESKKISWKQFKQL